MGFYADKIGEHNVSLCVTEDYQNYQTLGSGKVNVVSAPTAAEKLAFTYTIDGANGNNVYGNKLSGSVKITNNGTAAFADNLRLARVNSGDQNDQAFGTSKDVSLNPGESTTIDFDFEDCAYGRHVLVVTYISGSKLSIKSGSYKYTTLKKGVIVYNGDGSQQH